METEREYKPTVAVEGLRFPECPRWHDGALWFADYATQEVLRADLRGHTETVLTLEDVPSGLGWAPDGRLLVVSATARRLLRHEDGRTATVADLAGLVEHPCNDMVVDARGRAYISNMGYAFGDPEAQPAPAPILLVTPDGEARVAAEGLAFPNGLVITPDGGTLLVAESHAARITAFAIAPDGSLGPGRPWAEFGMSASGEGQITPDGMSLDAEGAVWVASPGTRDVLRVREGAEVVQRIPLDAVPLACMLGGPARRTLFIATTDSLDPGASDATGRIVALDVEVPGAGLP
jgi:sugar lactone lactonase YvrE